MISRKYRLTCGWKLSGTKNWRLASSKLLGVYGTNLQNPSNSLMQCVRSDDGFKFLQRDQSGAEALIVAYEAPRGRARELFELGIKPHSYMALQIFTDKFCGQHPIERYKGIYPKVLKEYPECDVLLKTIQKSPAEYDLGKRVYHAKSYDMGPRTFQVNCLEGSEGRIALTFAEAKHYLATHEATFPEILEYQAIIRGLVSARRELSNLFGYPRRFETIWSDALLRDAYAFIPQSTVGCITNLAYVEMFNYIRRHKLPWYLLNNKHDSFLWQVPDTAEHIEHSSTISKKFLEKDLTSSRGEPFTMRSSLSIGHNWGKYSETKNPDGMKEL